MTPTPYRNLLDLQSEKCCVDLLRPPRVGDGQATERFSAEWPCASHVHGPERVGKRCWLWCCAPWRRPSEAQHRMNPPNPDSDLGHVTHPNEQDDGDANCRRNRQVEVEDRRRQGQRDEAKPDMQRGAPSHQREMQPFAAPKKRSGDEAGGAGE
jgi:hypothetical protein